MKDGPCVAGITTCRSKGGLERSPDKARTRPGQGPHLSVANTSSCQDSSQDEGHVKVSRECVQQVMGGEPLGGEKVASPLAL
jgi:hypothetical protein